MPDEAHYRLLERLYLEAPTNEYYRPEISISDGRAEVRVALRSDFHHAAGGVHGSVYFKLLDDAAFFAANSAVERFLVLTASFNLYFLRPVAEGKVRALGRLVNRSRWLLHSEAELFDDEDRLLATGSGSFIVSRHRLESGPERVRGFSSGTGSSLEV